VKDHCKESGGDAPGSPPSPPREDEVLREELLSSSGSDADPLDKDYRPSPSPSSSEDELPALESQSSCDTTVMHHPVKLTPEKLKTRRPKVQQFKEVRSQKGSLKMTKQLLLKEA